MRLLSRPRGGPCSTTTRWPRRSESRGLSETTEGWGRGPRPGGRARGPGERRRPFAPHPGPVRTGEGGARRLGTSFLGERGRRVDGRRDTSGEDPRRKRGGEDERRGVDELAGRHRDGDRPSERLRV